MSQTPSDRGFSPRAAWILAGLAATATLVAGYLAWAAWRQHGLPVGCGENGGCAEVLTSRWSTVAGVPVGALAVPLYLFLGGLALRRPSRSTRCGLSFVSVILVTAAVWFVLLQVFVLRAICVWCLSEHVLGLIMAGVALWQVYWTSGREHLREVKFSSFLGLSLVLALAGWQIVQPAAPSTVRLPATPGSQQDDATETLSLLEGRLKIVPSQEPSLGDPAASHRLYLMFDYCCPHCRRTHAYLQEALALYPRQLSLICLPVPRDADCNPSISETESRFEHACELAELAVGVWLAQPSAFSQFDQWLFASPQPRSPEAARAKAAELIGNAKLSQFAQHRQARRRIARNILAFNDSQAGYLPVIMSPGMDTIVGRPASRDDLLQVLADELLLHSPVD